MNWFNLDAFDFGLLVFGCISFQNLLVIFFCVRFGVRVEKYALLIDPFGKSFYSRKVSGIKVVAGVLPFGGYVKPYYDTLNAPPMPFSMNSKSALPRIVIKCSGIIGWLFLLCMGLFFLQFATGTSGTFLSPFYFLRDMVLALFYSEAKTKFISTAPDFFINKPLLPLLLSLVSLFYILVAPIQLMTDTNSEKRQSRLLFWVTLSALVAIGYFMYWKLPILILSFFTLTQSACAILSFLLGMYTAAILVYFPLVFLLRRFYKQPG